ncbi:ATP-binding protein [Myxococcus sp. K15C18031901]|uniref:sensor histidine kinase n=1 Tax=Myxococcus dinghuensis TaxID=2906761 RepID=UPI0020A7273F|nr:ATP-binding protein [Myxococcus dinghuensis]MCP3103902.1 ATP-binding protein [Myxococcus dinghuensis]
MDARARRSFNDIQMKHIGRVFGRMVRLRAYGGLVLMAAVAGATLADGARWRYYWMVAQVFIALKFFFIELKRFKRHGFTSRSVPFNLGVGILLEQSLTLGTGGLASPLLPLLLPLAFVGAAVLPARQRNLLIVKELVLLSLLSATHLCGWIPNLHLSFLGEPPREMLIAVAITMPLLVLAANVVGAAIRGTFDDMLTDVFTQRDELLATHRVHARTLEALSAEIAHELKNPLATVKGLSQLMARETGRAQPTERLEVLQSEVTRMQGILEEFLNFSRPLVPLSISEVDIGALCDQALVLHEGVAAEHVVRLVRVGELPVLARCDPRKVKQVLMNLLLNAIDASPREGLVEVEVDANSLGEVRVSIRDSGAGISPELGARVFEAGVTSKARGSGLGLTVARALARQHGGEVTLRNAERGGCVAELLLPREPPSESLAPVREREVARAG